MVFPAESASVSESTVDANLVTANMVLPHQVESQNITKDYGRFVISPLESGYGLTLGNALRRILLSSLPGAAVTSIRVSDVHHEFSEIPYVREDMTQLILQIKQLRLILLGVESARLRLEHRGAEGIVTAADIWGARPKCRSRILASISSPWTIKTSTSKWNLKWQSGRGFSPAEERGRLPIGELPVDAVFSPIRRVKLRSGTGARGPAYQLRQTRA